MRKFATLAGAAALVLSLTLTGCGQSGRDGAGARGELSVSDLAIRGYRGTNLSVNGNRISAEGANEGVRGIALARDGSPVLVRFDVRGRQVRLRITQGGQTFDAPLADEGNSVMLGDGGASSAVVFTRQEEGQLQVKVSEVISCESAPAGTCAPLQAPAPEAPAPAAPHQ